MGEHAWPNGVHAIWGLRDHPEALFGVVDDRDGFAGYGSHGPVFAEEVQSVIGVEFALVVEGWLEIEQGDERGGPMVVAFLWEGQVPGGVGRLTGGATAVVLIYATRSGFGATRWRPCSR